MTVKVGNVTERILRWALVELGTAGLVDRLGREHVVPNPPPQWLLGDAAVAGPVLLLARQTPESEPGRYASFGVLDDHVFPGAVVLIRADSERGVAFGSNLALLAATLGARAILTNGTWRDSTRLALLALPMGSHGPGPASTSGQPFVRQRVMDLFGTPWQDGDWLLHDADGTLHLDGHLAASTADTLAQDFDTETAALVTVN